MNLTMMKKIARKSEHARYQHCSLIYAGSRLLAYGYNTNYKHAEIVALGRLEAILRTGNSRKPKNLHMVNLMIKRRSGTLGNSFPCITCHMEIHKYGIKNITYFNYEGKFIQCQTSV